MDIINIEIDVTKITKTKLKEVKRKDGTVAKFLKAALVPSRNDKFDTDYFIAESTSKEEREGGAKCVIIGNAKIFTRNSGQRPAQRQQAPAKQAEPDLDDIF